MCKDFYNRLAGFGWIGWIGWIVSDLNQLGIKKGGYCVKFETIALNNSLIYKGLMLELYTY